MQVASVGLEMRASPPHCVLLVTEPSPSKVKSSYFFSLFTLILQLVALDLSLAPDSRKLELMEHLLVFQLLEKKVDSFRIIE